MDLVYHMDPELDKAPEEVVLNFQGFLLRGDLPPIMSSNR